MSSNNLVFIDSVVGHEKGPIITALFISTLLIVFSLLSLGQLRKSKNAVIPEERLNAKGFFENVAEFVLKLSDDTMGKENRRYLPFLCSLFLFLLASNIIGLVPGFLMPTDVFQFNLGLALVVFGIYNYWGIKEIGLMKTLKHLWGPSLFVGFLLFPIELVSLCVRPLTLSLRLFGNMTGDHLTLSIFSNLTQGTVIFFIPLVFLILGTVVSLIQAFVFTLLTMIYIRSAVADEH